MSNANIDTRSVFTLPTTSTNTSFDLNASLRPAPSFNSLPQVFGPLLQKRTYACTSVGHIYIFHPGETIPESISKKYLCPVCKDNSKSDSDSSPSDSSPSFPESVLVPIQLRGNNISHSFMETLGLCPRRAFFRNELGLYSQSYHGASYRSQNKMDSGTFLHRGLEVWYKTEGGIKERKDAAFLELDRLFKSETLCIPLDEESSPEKGCHSYKKLLFIFANYLLKYQKDTLRLLFDANNKPLTEIAFAIQIEETEEDVDPNYDPDFPILFRGIIDSICSWNNDIYTVDHKTTGSITPASKTRARVSNQQTAYIHAAIETLGIKVTGALTNILGIFTNLDPEKHFLRIPVTRSPRDIQEWKESVVRKFRQYQIARETGIWDRETNGCTAFNSVCPFIEPCFASSAEMQRALLMGNFIHRRGKEKETEKEVEGAEEAAGA